MSINHSRALKKHREDATHCYYCDTAFEQFAPRENGHSIKTVDHFEALKLGGVNQNFNKVICCYKCNAFKESKTPQEFINHIDKVIAGTAKLKTRNAKFFTKERLLTIRKRILRLLCDRTYGKVKTEGYFSVHNKNK